MICASEVGTLSIDPSLVVKKGRLKPGRMLLVDTQSRGIVDDLELKQNLYRKKPFQQWIDENMLRMDAIVAEFKQKSVIPLDPLPLNQDPRLKMFGFTFEQLNMILSPMAKEGKEALGSMGADTPHAYLSSVPRLVYDYFRQLFAQVTNPPIDPIREEIVMSLSTYIGPEGNELAYFILNL
jgi:glutamate synthase (NADH)